jgi:hypothetical protein
VTRRDAYSNDGVGGGLDLHAQVGDGVERADVEAVMEGVIETNDGSERPWEPSRVMQGMC